MDDIVFFAGSIRATRVGSQVSINARGGVYIGGALGKRIGPEVKRMRVGYGSTSRRLVFEPTADAEDKSAPAILRNGGERGIRVQARACLHSFGLVPKESIHLDGVWTGSRIVVIVPEEMAPKPEQTAEDAENVDAVDGVDTVDDADGGAANPPSPGFCAGCAKFTPFAGQRTHGNCGDPQSPKYGHSVKIDGTCNRRITRPAFPDPSPPPPINHRSQIKNHKSSRPRAKCPQCGYEFSITSRGLYPHDKDGVAYAAGRGDRKRRCPGSNSNL